MPQLLDRDRERRALDHVLGRARQGLSSVLVVGGAPGIGKTRLLDYAVESATGFCVTRAAGVEAEVELGFAALQVLCSRGLDRVAKLPDPQANALQTAFGLRSGEPPDRFLVGLGVLSLLSELAGEAPVLWVLDDAQWLDLASIQVLGFVARRLEAESVVLLFGARAAVEALVGLPELVVPPLSRADARALLAAGISGPLDAEVEARIIAEAEGNPLALLELPRGSTPADVAGGFAVPRGGSISRPVENSFRQRIEALPADARRLLLLAAAEPLGDPDLLAAAADRLGLSTSAAAPAAGQGLLSIRAHVAFRHPLVRSVVYNGAPAEERRLVHGALAAVTNPATDPDRRAWHRAEASAASDEDVAAELERSATRAHARGGLAAEAAFMQRAAVLTPGGARRAERALGAAEAKLMVGALDESRELLELARQGPLEPLDSARLELVHANIQYASGAGDAPALLLQAAERLGPVAPELSRETYLEAIEAAARAGRLSQPDIREVAERAASNAPHAGQPPRAVDLLLDGLTARFSTSEAAAAPVLEAGLAAFRNDTTLAKHAKIQLGAAMRAANMRDEDTWELLVTRLIQGAREVGALSVLPPALESLGALEMFRGRFDVAARLIHESDTITTATGGIPGHFAEVALLGLRGLERETMSLVNAMLHEPAAGGQGYATLSAKSATAFLYNGLGRYELALAAALSAFAEDDTFYGLWAASEIIEAATRSGNPSAAAPALRRVSVGASSGTAWALGVQSRSRALVTDDARRAEELYVDAIARLGQTKIGVDIARAHLLYGEWLRRQRRRADARTQLRTAHEMFAAMPAEAFTERAARELRAAGGQVHEPAVDTTPQLTPQQMQIALLASDGRSNQEIAAQLFISPRTVEYHLHNIFIKLDIASRNQLDAAIRPVHHRQG